MNRRTLRTLCILEQLHTVRPLKMTAKQLLHGMHENEFDDEDEKSLGSLIEDLKSGGYISEHRDGFDRTIIRYTREEPGRVMLVENGRA